MSCKNKRLTAIGVAEYEQSNARQHKKTRNEKKKFWATLEKGLNTSQFSKNALSIHDKRHCWRALPDKLNDYGISAEAKNILLITDQEGNKLHSSLNVCLTENRFKFKLHFCDQPWQCGNMSASTSDFTNNG